MKKTEDGRRKKEVTLKFHVQPGAKSPGVAGMHGDAIKLRLASRPLNNRANEELLLLLADRLQLPPSALTIVRGHKSRSKYVRIVGATGAEVLRSLDL